MEINMIKTTAQLQQRFVEISEDNSFPKNFGTGENLIGLPPNDIYQLGFAAAFFECNRAVNQYVDAQTTDFMNTHAFQAGDPEQGWEKQCSVIAPDGLRHCGGYRADHPMQAKSFRPYPELSA
jgi:hypothetical protein